MVVSLRDRRQTSTNHRHKIGVEESNAWWRHFRLQAPPSCRNRHFASAYNAETINVFGTREEIMAALSTDDVNFNLKRPLAAG
jgi:hypothetical protein